MAFSEIPSVATSTPVITSGYGMGGGYGGYGYGGFGGTALAAGVGAALGSGLFGRGFGFDGRDGHGCHDCGHNNIVIEKGRGYGYGYDGYAPCCTPATCEQVNDVDRDVLKTGQYLEKNLCDCCMTLEKDIWNTDRDVLNGKYETEVELCNLGKEMACYNYGTSAQIADNKYALSYQLAENKYDNALQLCNMQHEIDKCCCKTNENITKMSYETQLRDACYKNDTDKQLSEIKCLIKETEKDEIIRSLQNALNESERCAQTRAIRDCIKDTFCKTSSALNQIGVNEQIINSECKWPPFVPSACCC